jgi:hypothetical protein
MSPTSRIWWFSFVCLTTSRIAWLTGEKRETAEFRGEPVGLVRAACGEPFWSARMRAHAAHRDHDRKSNIDEAAVAHSSAMYLCIIVISRIATFLAVFVVGT